MPPCRHGDVAGTRPARDGARGLIVNTVGRRAEGQIGQVSHTRRPKAGVVGTTLTTIARDLAAVGIRCNTIIPGLIDTIYGQGEAAEQFGRSSAPAPC